MFEIAEVRNFEDDPTRSGRCQIRIYNKQNDEQQIEDKHLPWAQVLHPITSPATGRMGISPSGLVVGSRVLITYLPDDHSKQYPIILGSLARGAKAEGQQSSTGGVSKQPKDAVDNSGGKIDDKNRGIDNPSYTSEDSV